MTLEGRIKQAAMEHGFSFAAIAPVTPPPYADRLNDWLDAGHAGEMGWLEKNREKRQDPRLLQPCTKSILVVGLNYFQFVPPELLNDPSRGRFARYALGKDYHDLIVPRLRILADEVSDIAGRRVESRAYTDTGPLLERPVAFGGNAGFLGKNTLLIRRDLGSYFFLGELLLDLELEPDPEERVSFGCGICHRCGTNCPTGALETEFSVKANLCISYLTIEHRGPIPRNLRPKMGNWVYGCDVCQEVCPYNARNQMATTEEFFMPLVADAAAPKLSDLMSLDQDGFSRRFRGSAVKRTKRRGLLRNTAIALGNWGSDEALPALKLGLKDQEPLVRGHAAWGVGQVAGVRSKSLLEQARSWEEDATVLTEINLALEERG
ncbi:tRNA epoxyqueuosine(34) reductase QueG [bacterium]|nr:tRNA epoxyqueuosine(34) reductase QueG [bacterium]